MKQVLISLVLFFGIVQTTMAAHDHSAEVCSTLNAALCLHLGFHSPVTTEAASEFMVHFTSDAQALAAITNLNVELWMPSMGHGSSPVVVTKRNDAFYKVTEAWFVMSGDWEVRVSFMNNGVADQIIVPVTVK